MNAYLQAIYEDRKAKAEALKESLIRLQDEIYRKRQDFLSKGTPYTIAQRAADRAALEGASHALTRAINDIIDLEGGERGNLNE